MNDGNGLNFFGQGPKEYPENHEVNKTGNKIPKKLLGKKSKAKPKEGKQA